MIGDYIRRCVGGPGKTASGRGWYSVTTYEIVDIIDSDDDDKPKLKMKEVSPKQIDKSRTIHPMGGFDGVHPLFQKIIEVDENGDIVDGSVWNRE